MKSIAGGNYEMKQKGGLQDIAPTFVQL